MKVHDNRPERSLPPGRLATSDGRLAQSIVVAIALLASTLVVVALSACGETRRRTEVASHVSPPTPVPARVISSPAPNRPGIDDAHDGDDGATRELEEHDDYELTRFGRPADGPLFQLAVLFARRYFAAAASADGAAACSLLTPSLAQGLAENHNTPATESSLRGATCAEVMTKLLGHLHSELAAKAAGLEVTGVRATPSAVRVLLAFRRMSERRYLSLAREADGSLRLEGALRDSSYP